MDINKCIADNCDLNIKVLNKLIKSKVLKKEDNETLSYVVKSNKQIKKILQYCFIKTKNKQNVQ